MQIFITLIVIGVPFIALGVLVRQARLKKKAQKSREHYEEELYEVVRKVAKVDNGLMIKRMSQELKNVKEKKIQ